MSATTKHAKIRYQQRGIDRLVAECLIEFGETQFAPRGAVKICLSRRNTAEIVSALKKEIQKIERASSVILVQKDGEILTGYHRN